MALLGLNLNGLLGNVTDTVNEVLGGGLGDVLGGVAPGGLVDDLGDTLNDALTGGGDPTGLLKGLLDNNLIDLGQLQDILNSGANGSLDLSSLENLLTNVSQNHLQVLLDDVFDKSGILGLGDTIIATSALDALGPVDVGSTVTYVTNLVGTIVDVAGTTTDAGLLLDSLLIGDDTINGTDAGEKLQGRAGNDSIHGNGGNDTLSGGDANDTVYGDAGNDSLTGDAGADKLYGGAGVDTLNGGAGSDTMTGGDGSDVYYVSSAGDRIVESAGAEGRDIVYSAVDYTLGANLEVLRLTGSAIRGTGNDLANSVGGDAQNNILNGKGGNDLIIGHAGADTMFGGGGRDIFEYDFENDSGKGSGHRDLIMDFDANDRIWMRGLDADASKPNDQAFEFLGVKGFDADGVGQINYKFFEDTTIVRVDLNGDKTVDFEIQLMGQHNLTAGNFIL